MSGSATARRLAGQGSAWLAALALAALGHAAPGLAANAGPAEPAAASSDRVPTGKMIAAEPLAAGLGLRGAGAQLRFRYSSTEGTDRRTLVTVSGALFIPPGKPPAGGWPIVAWAHGTVGIADHCAPSLAGRSPRDLEYLGSWLAEGYAIVATDYRGLGTPGPHPYLDSRAAAYDILDAVRAALSSGSDLANRVVIVGQSQGAAAAISAAAFAPSYAPDIGLVATVATGVPNVKASLGRANRAERSRAGFDPAAAYLLYLAASASQRDPSLRVADAITPEARKSFEAAKELCALPLLGHIKALGLTQERTVTPAFFSIFAPAIAAADYPSLALAHPLFVGIGGNDVDTPAAGQLEIVEKARAAGSKVDARVYPGGDHSSTVNASFPDSSRFVRELLGRWRDSPPSGPGAPPLQPVPLEASTIKHQDDKQ